MSDQNENDMVQAVYEFAASQVVSGKKKSQVETALLEKGLDAESAKIVTANVFKMRGDAISAAGKKNMLYGLLWCIGGAIVTAATYQMAANSPNGGSYVVAWGAIVFGGIQFLRGAAQAARLG
jgi:hypothetical protein